MTGPFPGFPVPLEGDDVTELIEKHRDELPFSDQLPTLDPPTHTNHRSLLMRLITPKRLKENEDAMWALADQAARRVPGAGGGRVHQGLRRPVHAAGHRRPAGRARGRSRQVRQGHPPSTRAAASAAPARSRWRTAHWNSSTGLFSDYVLDRRREPRDDVLTGLATATFPDGRHPTSETWPGLPANVFSAGQETTVRLLGAALQTHRGTPRHPGAVAQGPQPDPELHRRGAAHREPGQGRLPA